MEFPNCNHSIWAHFTPGKDAGTTIEILTNALEFTGKRAPKNFIDTENGKKSPLVKSPATISIEIYGSFPTSKDAVVAVQDYLRAWINELCDEVSTYKHKNLKNNKKL